MGAAVPEHLPFLLSRADRTCSGSTGCRPQAALRDGSIVIRRGAVEALVVAPDPAAAETLAKMFQSEEDMQLKRSILRALAACS